MYLAGCQPAPPRNPLQQGSAFGDPVDTPGFGEDQSDPVGGLPDPGAALARGTVATTAFFGEAPKTGSPPPVTGPGQPSSGGLKLDLGGNTPPAAPAQPAPAPRAGFGAFFRRELERHTGKPWDKLVARGHDVIAAALRPQSVLQGNMPVREPKRAGSGGVVLHSDEPLDVDRAGTLGVQIAQSTPRPPGRPTRPGQPNNPLRIPRTFQQLGTNAHAETVLRQILELNPNYAPPMRERGAPWGDADLFTFQQVLFRLKSEQLRIESLEDVVRKHSKPEAPILREMKVLTYAGERTADRLYAHDVPPPHPDVDRRTFWTSLKVPPGAKVDRSVLQTGVPLGFDTREEFRGFRNVTVDDIRAAVRARIGEDAAAKLKIGIRGSAISGQKFIHERGPFGRGFNSESDFDIFIISPELFAKFTELTGRPVRDGAVHVDVKFDSKEALRLGLDQLLQDIEKFAPLRKTPSIRIFKNGTAPNAKSPREKGPALHGPATLLLNP